MLINDKNRSLQLEAFSNQPFSFTSPEVHHYLAAITEINLIENGERAAREHWQKTQLYNLLNFAYTQSAFWKKRMPATVSKDNLLKDIPILSREEVALQVNTEGSLAKDIINAQTQTYASSGSTGTPVKVHICPQNARYNEMRSMAQYFMESRPLNENRTFIKPADGQQMLDAKQGIKVEKFDTWLGGLHQTFKSGRYKIIYFAGDEDALINELLKDRVGYLACLSSHLDIIFKKGGVELINKLGIRMWLHHSDTYDDHQRDALESVGIPVRSNYSCSELGPIAVQCTEHAGHYHVTHSNLIVEVDKDSAVEINGVEVARVLLTHLHSYATPLIRYDVGDYARLLDTCPCGHDGTTLSHIYGRRKYFLKCADGSFLPFIIFSKPLLDITSFTEFFVYQSDVHTIVIELGGRKAIEPTEEKNIQDFIKRLSHQSFNVIVKAVEHIDWSRNPKRLSFVCFAV